MMFYDNPNLVNTAALHHQQQQPQYFPTSSQGGFAHLVAGGSGPGALICHPNQQILTMSANHNMM